MRPFINPVMNCRAQDMAVGIVTRLWAGQPYLISNPHRGKIFSSPKREDRCL